jgi:hypothetical protein
MLRAKYDIKPIGGGIFVVKASPRPFERWS